MHKNTKQIHGELTELWQFYCQHQIELFFLIWQSHVQKTVSMVEPDVKSDDKTLETLLTLHLYHIRKEPATKQTSYLKSQSTITYIPILTLFLLSLLCTFNFCMQYSVRLCKGYYVICHMNKDLSGA